MYLFSATVTILDGSQELLDMAEYGPLKGHPYKAWFNFDQWFHRERFLNDFMSKSA
jgi:hypothetical protein